jgi:hypothetical protein
VSNGSSETVPVLITEGFAHGFWRLEGARSNKPSASSTLRIFEALGTAIYNRTSSKVIGILSLV